MEKGKSLNKVSAATLLVTLGIIYGDIGTSPLYVFKAIIGKDIITEQLILGSLSCVFWTLVLQTTVKYVIITLRADNNGEGGIFSLFALVRRRAPSLVGVAIVGGSALLADGIITPPISVSSAIEGLLIYNPEIKTIPIVIAILIGIFLLQSFGTKTIGSAFGPIMFIWFLMLAVLGVMQIGDNFDVFRALNPYYAIDLLTRYPNGFWLLSAVFLCTTGAEALYSDLGHCGRGNIRISWVFVKICLLLNYFGQGVWALGLVGKQLEGKNPFYSLMPQEFLIFGVIIATMAAIIASQALITGSFTLISESIRLNLWPKVKIKFPTILKGQIYVPSINWLLMFGCIGVVLYFKESEHMEGAYGLAISLTMMMTSVLLSFYLIYVKRINTTIVAIGFLFYFVVEGSFLIANLSKFMNGGFVTLMISFILITVMWVWYAARKIKNRLTEFVQLKDYFPLLRELSSDLTVSKYATHLVYLTSANNPEEIESKIIYSIFQKQPKRADIYWFLHIDVVDEPYTMEYSINILIPDDVIRVEFRLGFRVEQKVNLFFRKVVEEMVRTKEVDFTSRYTSLSKRNVIGDFRFVVLEKHLSFDNQLPKYDQMIMDLYFILKEASLSETSAFGLDTSSVSIEKVPMVIHTMEQIDFVRVKA
jgi:KUP system potassium uptake protein